MRMIEIIPAINEDSFEEIERKITLIEPHVRWAHIDVTDGTFTRRAGWHEASELFGLTTKLSLELHLMIAPMEERIMEWLLPPMHRAIFHVEAARNPSFVIKKIKEAGKEAGLALKLETPWANVRPYAKEVDLLQALCVEPGYSGQVFKEEMYEKIRRIKRIAGHVPLEVDGGVTIGMVRQCSLMGATLFAASSAIFSAPDIAAAIKELSHDES